MSAVSGHSLKITRELRVYEIRRMHTTRQFRNFPAWLLCKNVSTKIWVASCSQQVLVNIVMNLRVKWRVGNFLSVLMTLGSSKRTAPWNTYWLRRNEVGIQQQQSNFDSPPKILVKEHMFQCSCSSPHCFPDMQQSYQKQNFDSPDRMALHSICSWRSVVR